MKASRFGLEDDDGSEKNTPSSSTFAKLVLPIESCGRRSSVQLCVWDGVTLARKKNMEWTWASNINGASYVSSVAIEDVDGDSQTEIVTGGYCGTSWELAQLAVWNGHTLVLKSMTGWYGKWADGAQIYSVTAGDVDVDGKNEVVTGGRDNDLSVARGWWAELCVWNGVSLEVKNVKMWNWTGATEINSGTIATVVDSNGNVFYPILTGGGYGGTVEFEPK